MISVQGCIYPHKERPSVALLNSSLPFDLGDELSDHPTRSPKINFPIAFIPIAIPPIPKYTKKDL